MLLADARWQDGDKTCPDPVFDGEQIESVRAALRRYTGGCEEQKAFARFDSAHEAADVLLAWCGRELLEAAQLSGEDGLRHVLDHDLAELDGRIMRQLDVILRHPDLQKLEATWRGVLHLIETAEDDVRVKVRILPVTWSELGKDFDKALEFDQSALFAKIYNEEFGMAGGLPYGLLLCDHQVRHKRDASYRIDDVGVLAELSQVAAAAFAPCLIGISPQFLGVENFADLAATQDITSVLSTPEYARWRSLQSRDDSRFLGAVLPRVLLRTAWIDDGARQDGFRFREGWSGLDDGTWLWGSGIYAMAAVAIRAFRDWGWFADIRGTRVDLEEAGLVTGLPSPAFSTTEPTAYRRPVEIEFTDHKQRAFEQVGLIALSPCRLTQYLAVLSTPSLRVPEGATSAIVDANERLSSMLHYVLCASRFAHYIKVITRDRIGAFTTADMLQEHLQKWLLQYVNADSDAGFDAKASSPLRGGRVEIFDIPGRPGSYNCTIQLSPHFQIDQVVAAFRFQTEIKTTRAA